MIGFEKLEQRNMLSVAGDFDLNGTVDGLDFLLLQRNPTVGLLSDWETNYGQVDTGVELADTFGGLDNASSIIIVTGDQETVKYESEDFGSADDLAFDARGATFSVEVETNGMISLDAVKDGPHTGVSWYGGYVQSIQPWDASWDDHKDGNGPGGLGVTRNGAALSIEGEDVVISGLGFFNVHDGVRTNKPENINVTIQHIWGEYVRDDFIEADNWNSLTVFDVLADGVSGFLSTHPSSSHPEFDGTGQVALVDKALVRMLPMPYPFSDSGAIDENGDEWTGQGVPYRHGSLWKIEDDDLARHIHFDIRNSVILTDFADHKASKFAFPQNELIDNLENVTLIWLGEGEYPGTLPVDWLDEITILTGQEGLDFWEAKVLDWHMRHPDVNPGRVPVDHAFGEVKFPITFPLPTPAPLVTGMMGNQEINEQEEELITKTVVFNEYPERMVFSDQEKGIPEFIQAEEVPTFEVESLTLTPIKLGLKEVL